MEFKAIPRTIADTLELRRKYIIPRFQRDYSWENDELTELWDDLLDCFIIKDGILSPCEYFIGSLVLVGDDDDNMNVERQVVDGQQRLMTITIAFSVLYDIFNNLGDKKVASKMYEYIVGEDADGVEYTKLITESPKPFFQMRIQGKEKDISLQPQTEEEKRIFFAYNFFEKKLSEKNLKAEISSKYCIDKAKLKYIDLLKLFRDQILHCKVIYVTVKSFEDAYTIFEVLNAKGKDLEPLDVIKNSIFSIIDSTEPVDWAEEQWKILKKNIIASNNIQVFYRHFWLSKYSYTTTKKLVKEFNSKIEKNQDSYINFMKDLVMASRDYKKISNPNRNDWTQPEDLEIFNALEAFEIFGVTQIRIFLLSLFDVRRNNMISHKNFIRVLTFLKNFHFIFNAICSMRPSGLERRYSSYARRLRECKSKEKTKECIDDLIAVLKDTLPIEEHFVNDFLGLEYTSFAPKDKKIVQYVLKQYEYKLMRTQEVQPLSFTIEHIRPESSRDNVCGKIGNLLPLGEKMNSDLQNKAFTLKLNRYKESHYVSTRKFYDDNKDKTEWTEEMIIERTKLIAITLYGML